MKSSLSAKISSNPYGAGDEKRNVLDGVSVEINAGEFVAVMGPSGSGKSTLLFALSGMDGVDSGSVFFDGVDLARLNDNALADIRRTKMGFVFQQPTLLRNLNILDNIILPSMRNGRRNGTPITAKAKTLMEKTDIAGLELRDITQASGGQLQRVGICRALMSDPQIIFGDEPTGASELHFGQRDYGAAGGDSSQRHDHHAGHARCPGGGEDRAGAVHLRRQNRRRVPARRVR
jgi:putative ABC transport system ATP-binding protein